MREPSVKKELFWCDSCNIPLIGRRCGCGREARAIPLLEPYDLRPALRADCDLIQRLINERFGAVPLPDIILLNKTGGRDRSDLIIMNGSRFGWLLFDPVSRQFSLDIAVESLSYLLNYAADGIVNLDDHFDGDKKVRIGGKRFPLKESVREGTVIVRYRRKYGTGVVRDGHIRVKELVQVSRVNPPNPDWKKAIQQNEYHLKLMERDALRIIKKHKNDRPTANASFSGGKDSAAVLHLARKAGVDSAFFIDTGIELPETIQYIESQGVHIIRKAGDFFAAAEKAGPPGKDHRWCCKLLKLHPLRAYLSEIGPSVTFQGNRWYESWNRADLDETSQNPANPLQLNVSPIRNWRAFEVFLYLWWQNVPINPLYDMGLERIGCYLCPAMLESEYEQLRSLHPELTDRWDRFLIRWAEDHGLPDAYHTMGLWRWKALPPKMRELCREYEIPVNKDFTLRENQVQKKEEGMLTREKRNDESQERNTSAHFSETIRRDFPIIHDCIYLDSAAISLSPEPVVNAVVEFEHRYRSNVGRGIHRFTQIASQRYWHAHEKVARFIGGEEGTTVFTKNTTESINMVAHGLSWKPGDRVITTILEHHSNLLPWRALAEEGVELSVIGIRPDYSLDLKSLEEEIKKGARLAAITHASNAIGVVTPVKEIAKICRRYNTLLLIDAAQSIPHMPVNVGDIGCDFCCFSGHKMLAPTGTGVLWMREPIIEPMMLGGGMIEEVHRDGFVPIEGYQKYEAGTPNISGGIGLGVAVDYLNTIGMEQVRCYEEGLTTQLIKSLSQIEGVTVFAPTDSSYRIGVVSFSIKGLHPHEVAERLDHEYDILVRSGHHCCQPLMESLGLPNGTVRASLALYTTETEIDLLAAAVQEITRSL
ncbi:aminotransferase class V-fold PLP-dependent enzyme [Methanocalculus taiwanensis]|uniref:cysteine desulfurase n=1 Tax=Methanocalculus taiwanensis TaxID=106207 RepID=A0ABD4TM95_9EURY|nr:aminotransferase class V-fold PLP-dependent enzyme [Methanocalculus taiwanensis]MCQ1539108.1 aminotransferase class V-fold PLP-dependent enzyme [Methanocalculus taiwanensis]